MIPGIRDETVKYRIRILLRSFRNRYNNGAHRSHILRYRSYRKPFHKSPALLLIQDSDLILIDRLR